MAKIVTRESFQAMLDKDNPAFVATLIGSALVVIFNNQTRDEKDSNDTTHTNNIGFTGADARSGSITAKYFLKHKTLQAWQIDRWLKPSKATGFARIAKYHAQLNVAAVIKQAAKKKAMRLIHK